MLLPALLFVTLAQEAPDSPSLAARVRARIAAERLRSDVERLAAFGTRHTLSETESETRGIGAARRWLEAELARAGGRLEVATESFVLPPSRRIAREVELVNVRATLSGTQPEARARTYVVLAHYDSRASGDADATADAPGANDDGSGSALVLEVARALANEELDSTVVFLLTAGEEQGLYGATQHVEAALAAGVDVRAALSNDIVGDPTGPPDADGAPRRRADAIRLFSEGLPAELDGRALARLRRSAAEGDSPSRQLARYVADVARRERTAVQPVLILKSDRALRGGDHEAFAARGIPAVRFTEFGENYDRQHQDVREEDGVRYGDLPEFVDADYLADVARLNATALVHLANAPSVPPNARVVLEGLAPTTTLVWDASPEPDVAGYEVVWRATTSADWDEARDVGRALEATLELCVDDWFFGVRAYDAEGYRSPVAFAGFGRR